jgi:hypothetical protein
MVGSVRSETSMPSWSLSRIGHLMGDGPFPTADAKAKGHFKDQAIIRINEDLMQVMGTCGSYKGDEAGFRLREVLAFGTTRAALADEFESK